MSTFRINANWVGATNPKNELDASLASLNILLDDKNLTAYRTSQGREFNSVRVPTYYLAEWMAENWWALLYEPRKKDDLDQALVPDDEDFLDRHSMSAAEHGFVLPSIRIVPVGRAVRVSATPHKAEFADAEFKNKGQADISRPDVEATFERSYQAPRENWSGMGYQALRSTRLGRELKIPATKNENFVS